MQSYTPAPVVPAPVQAPLAGTQALQSRPSSVDSLDGRGIEGVGIGLETDASFGEDVPSAVIAAAGTKNPYLDKNRLGAGSPSWSPNPVGG